MYNFFKAVFGVPPNGQERLGMDNDRPIDEMNHFRGGDGNDDDDDDDDNNDDINNIRSPFGENTSSFGFPIFSDPIEIHKYFEGLVNEMHKKFETFGYHNFPNTTWEDNQSSFFNEEPARKPESLRDSFLKSPGYINDNAKKEDVDLDGQVKVRDIENLLRRDPEAPREVQPSPKIFSKSVFIRTIRRPDGTVEIIKKVRDHTGKEETTITQDTVHNPNSEGGSLFPADDVPGMSIFKKFFSF